MALIRCTECRKKFSDKASACPNCGAPTAWLKDTSREKKAREAGVLKVGAFIFVLFAIPYACSQKPDGGASNASSNSSARSGSNFSTETPAPSPPATPIRAPILPHAIEEYTPKSYPKAYKKFGNAAMKRANAGNQQVAEMVSMQKNCDSVALVSFSDVRSTKSEIVWFADCKNGQRFYVSESDLKAGATIRSNQDIAKAFDNYDNQLLCEQLIKAKLPFPSSYDKNFGGTRVTANPTGSISFQISFEAKNSLGNAVPLIGECKLSAGKMELVAIQPR